MWSAPPWRRPRVARQEWLSASLGPEPVPVNRFFKIGAICCFSCQDFSLGGQDSYFQGCGATFFSNQHSHEFRQQASREASRDRRLGHASVTGGVGLGDAGVTG